MKIMAFIFWLFFSTTTCNLQNPNYIHYILHAFHHHDLEFHDFEDILSFMEDLSEICTKDIASLKLEEKNLLIVFHNGETLYYPLEDSSYLKIEEYLHSLPFTKDQTNSFIPSKTTTPPCCPHSGNSCTMRDEEEDNS